MSVTPVPVVCFESILPYLSLVYAVPRLTMSLSYSDDDASEMMSPSSLYVYERVSVKTLLSSLCFCVYMTDVGIYLPLRRVYDVYCVF